MTVRLFELAEITGAVTEPPPAAVNRILFRLGVAEKLEPLILTVDPIWPLDGLMSVICGFCGAAIRTDAPSATKTRSLENDRPKFFANLLLMNMISIRGQCSPVNVEC